MCERGRRLRDRITRPLLLALAPQLLAPAAQAQDVFALLGAGAEAKAHAGAGALASRGSPALLYNPANLIESRGLWEPYLELAVATFKYSYEYPGYFPIEVDRTAEVPFLGATLHPAPDLWLALNFLPLPASAGAQEIENFPTRKFTEEPILVDVSTTGKGFGFRASLGAAYKITNGLGVGVSALATKGGASLTATDVQSASKIATDESESSSFAAIAGVRASALKGRLYAALAVAPPATSRSKGRTVLHIFEDAEVPKEGSAKGPLGVTAAAGGKVAWGLAPFVELTHRGWGALRDQEAQAGLGTAKHDYFDTLDAAFGLDWQREAHQLSAAFGSYQSPLGEGIMASEAPDEVELIGMEFQNLDAVPHTRLGLGYRYAFAPTGAYLQSALAHASGSRTVWEKARGYGDYKLAVTTVSVAGALRF